MAPSRETITWREYETSTNLLALYPRDSGLRAGDPYAIVIENNTAFFGACGAGVRAGLYYTRVDSHLAADEAACIVDHCDAGILITSRAKHDIALAAAKH